MAEEAKKEEKKEEKPKEKVKEELVKQPDPAPEPKPAPEPSVEKKESPKKEAVKIKVEEAYTLNQIQEAWEKWNKQFQSAINSSQPFPDFLKGEEIIEKLAEVPKEEKKDTPLLRSEETGDRVFLIKKDKRHWVMNPETLQKLGFRLGEEKTVSFDELNKYPEGDPIDLTIPGSKEPSAEQKSGDTEGEKELTPEEASKPHKVWS